MLSDEEGWFWFKGLKLVSYLILYDGLVGKLLERLGRYLWRLVYIYFMFEKEGWDKLIM